MILGKHTLDETRDLLAVADYRFSEVEKTIAESKNLPQDIINDWNALLPKWKATRSEIVSELRKKSFLAPASPASIIATEPEYVRVLSFVQGQELVKGSFQDIVSRLRKFLAPLPPDHRLNFTKDPKQVLTDVDQSLFKELDKDIKQGEAAAVVVKEKAKEVVQSNTALIIGGTVLGTLVVAGVVKHYLYK